jgi:adenylosuccinate synthase
MARVGVRASLLTKPDAFEEGVRMHVDHANRLLSLYDQPPLDADEIVKEYAPLAARFAPFVADTTALVHATLERGEQVLAEGAQGTLLDIDHGTYPFVTSSSTITGGVLTSLGVGPKHVKRVVGVAKAFCSRVGAGPFPTELNDKMGARLRGTGANPWDEYGSTTGRPRRTGWLDLVALKYAARVNGFTEIVLTKLDILTGIHPLKVCIAYSSCDEPLSNFPSEMAVLNQCQPIYSELPGWDENISRARRIEDLPLAARVYILQIETFTGVSVSHVSVGPEREQIFEV